MFVEGHQGSWRGVHDPRWPSTNTCLVLFAFIEFTRIAYNSSKVHSERSWQNDPRETNKNSDHFAISSTESRQFSLSAFREIMTKKMTQKLPDLSNPLINGLAYFQSTCSYTCDQVWISYLIHDMSVLMAPWLSLELALRQYLDDSGVNLGHSCTICQYSWHRGWARKWVFCW